MIRFNTQIADLVENEDLCRTIFKGFELGQSVRHIANKHDISDYAVKKLVQYWRKCTEEQYSDET